jgi:heavy metal sensor kinase
MSLAGRLCGFFLAALALVLLGFSLTLFLLARSYLYGQARERLTATLETLTAAAEVEPSWVEWETHAHQLALPRASAADLVRWAVHDTQGNLVDHAGTWREADLAQLNPAPRSGEAMDQQTVERGRPWCWLRRELAPARRSEGPDGTKEASAGTQVPADPGAVRYPALVLTAGVCLEPVQRNLSYLALVLACVSSFLWLSAAVLGRRLCRRGLAPLSAMAAAARGLDVTDPSQRLPGPGTSDELEELGDAFNGLLTRLQEALERQRRFAGDASHQLRTPLAALLGQVEVTLRRERSAAEYCETISCVHQQASHLRAIVEALLFLARADSDAVLDHVAEMDLAPWLTEHLQRRALHPRFKDLRVEFTSDGMFPIRAHPTLLGQLFDNLLENAWKYSGAGTQVKIRLEHEAGVIRISVEDEGCGIAPEDLPHIFRPFYRSSRARRAGFAGVGLGLAVCQRIAQALGGTLDVQSSEGQGTRFTLGLPESRALGPSHSPIAANSAS